MDDFILKTLLSLAIGAVIGIERENTGKSLGLRSFSIICFLGLLVSLLTDSIFLILIGLSGIFLLSAIYYFRSGKGSKLSLSTALMIPFTFVLGILISKGLFLEAGASGILVAFILSQKDRLHLIISSLSRRELTDGLIFCIASIVIYPLMPLVPILIFGIPFDLKQAWLVVVLVMFLSFFSHLLIKYKKGRGALYSTFLSSWVSSLIYLSLVIKKLNAKDDHSFKLYFLVTTLGVLTRSALIVLIFTPSYFRILTPLLLPFLACLVWTFFALDKDKMSLKPLDPEFSIWYALKFSVFFTIVSLIVLSALSYNTGVYLAFLGSGMLSSASGFAILSTQFANIPLSVAVFAVAFIFSGDIIMKNVLLLPKLKVNRFKAIILPSVILILLAFIGVFL